MSKVVGTVVLRDKGRAVRHARPGIKEVLRRKTPPPLQHLLMRRIHLARSVHLVLDRLVFLGFILSRLDDGAGLGKGRGRSAYTSGDAIISAITAIKLRKTFANLGA